MGKRLKGSSSTLKVFQVGEISGVISNEKYERLLAINPAYADLFEESDKEPEPLFVSAKKEVKEAKTKNQPKNDIQA